MLTSSFAHLALPLWAPESQQVWSGWTVKLDTELCGMGQQSRFPTAPQAQQSRDEVGWKPAQHS